MKTKFSTTADFAGTRVLGCKAPTLRQLADRSKDGCGWRAVELRAIAMKNITRLDIQCEQNGGKRTMTTFANFYLGPVSRAALIAQIEPKLIEAMRSVCDAYPAHMLPTMREFLAYVDSVSDPTGMTTQQRIDPLVNRTVDDMHTFADD